MPEYKKHTKTNEDISKDRGATSEGLLLIINLGQFEQRNNDSDKL